jgi:hypothetical protein
MSMRESRDLHFVLQCYKLQNRAIKYDSAWTVRALSELDFTTIFCDIRIIRTGNRRVKAAQTKFRRRFFLVFDGARA